MDGVVYHGSPQGGIKELRINPSAHKNPYVYATSNKIIALIFTSKGRGDLDTNIRVDEKGKIILTERRAGVLEELYKGKSGYIYTLSGENFKHYDYMWGPEVVSEQNESVIGEEKIDNLLDKLIELHQTGRIQLNFYPQRPDDMPIDNRDLIPKYINLYRASAGKSKALDDLLSVYPEFRGDLSLYTDLNVSPQVAQTTNPVINK